MQVQKALSTSELPPLEKEILLSKVLQRNRTWLLTNDSYHLTSKEEQYFQDFLNRRKSGEPIAYIIGTKEFYGRDFFVSPAVLIPRPSTEGLIDLTLEFLQTGKENAHEVDTEIIVSSQKFANVSDVQTIVDIGTGSGCIAITLAIECPEMRIIATDVSADALSVARNNAEKHRVTHQINFRKGDGFKPICDLQDPFIIVSNPPYIPSKEKVMDEVKNFEPHNALFAGEDGMDVARKLVKDADDNPYCRGIALECRKEQAKFLLNEVDIR